MFQKFQVNMIVATVEPCAAFYRAVGFEETYRFPAGGVAEHVEVRAVGLTLGISSSAAAQAVHELDLAGAGNAVQICLWCDDVDTAFAAMLRAGGEPVREPRDFQDGRLRNGWVRDPGGNFVEITQRRR